MFLIIKLTFHYLKSMDSIFYRDPRLSHLPMVGAPWPMLATLALYLLIVKKWGPKFMQKRKPFDLQRVMQAYNLMQVAVNFYIFYGSLRYSYMQSNFSFTCQGYDTTDIRQETLNLRYPAYVYYISKYLDLLDTIFFVLRKKNKQVSFLHVYHHSVMVYAVWVYCTLTFGTHVTFLGIVNSFIHVCMYSYYFITSLKLDMDLNAWKQRLTQLQIIQFLLLTLHLSQPIWNGNTCGADLFWITMASMQNFFILLLFIDFYLKSYVLKRPPRATFVSDQIKAE